MRRLNCRTPTLTLHSEGDISIEAKGQLRITAASLAETIKGFTGLIEGNYDHLPEAAFYMVGAIDEAVEKAQKLAAEAA